MEKNTHEYADPTAFKLKKVFNRRKKDFPPFGASNVEHILNLKNSLKRKLIYLFSIALLLFVAAFIFLMMSSFYVEGALTCIALAFIFVAIKAIVDIDNNEIITLLSECKDAEMLNKVAIAAKSSLGVEQQLKLLANSGRNFLCWYEVFILLAIEEVEFNDSSLQEAKSRIAQMVNSST